MTQIEKIQNYLKDHAEITQRDAYKLGIYRLGARIWDMNAQGIRMKSERRRVRNADGTYSHIGVYSYDRNKKPMPEMAS